MHYYLAKDDVILVFMGKCISFVSTGRNPSAIACGHLGAWIVPMKEKRSQVRTRREKKQDREEQFDTIPATSIHGQGEVQVMHGNELKKKQG